MATRNQTTGRYGRDYSIDSSGFSASCYRKNHNNCNGVKVSTMFKGKYRKTICTCDCH